MYYDWIRNAEAPSKSDVVFSRIGFAVVFVNKQQDVNMAENAEKKDTWEKFCGSLSGPVTVSAKGSHKVFTAKASKRTLLPAIPGLEIRCFCV